MRYEPGKLARLELSRRNLQTLLAKLDDPLSARTLSKLAEDGSGWIDVVAVEDEEHYEDRFPGPVYMPSTGQTF